MGLGHQRISADLHTKAIVVGYGPVHVGKATAAALAARAHWLTGGWLSKYARELNDIEAVWHNLGQLEHGNHDLLGEQKIFA